MVAETLKIILMKLGVVVDDLNSGLGFGVSGLGVRLPNSRV